MQPYVIAMSPKPDEEVKVVLQGPGIDPSGKSYVFATPARCELFVDALNFAYAQGIEEGLRLAAKSRADVDHSVVVISGRHPETLMARPENRWEHVKRSWRETRRRT